MPLFTSAVPGKKAAPKAPARRRPAPTGPPPSAQPLSTAATSVAPPSPPPTQTSTSAQEPPVHHELPPAKEPSQPASEPVREPEVERLQRQAPQPATLAPEPASIPIVLHEETPSVPPAQISADAPQPQPTVQPTPPPTETDTVHNSAEPQIETGDRQDEGVAAVAPPSRGTEDLQPTQRISHPDGSIAQKQVPDDRSQVSEANFVDAATSATQKRASKRTRASASNAAPPRPTKRTKKSSTRSNAKVTAVANGEDVALPSIESPTTGDGSRENVSRRRQPARKAAIGKIQRNAKSAATIIDSDDETEGLEGARSATQEPNAGAQKPARKVKRARKTRSSRQKAKRATPGDAEDGEEDEPQVADDESDAELHEVDPSTLSMWDLTYDTRHGKMSDMGKKMNDINWDDVATKRRIEADRIASGGQPLAEDASGEGAPQPAEGEEGRTGANEEAAGREEGQEAADDVVQGATQDAIREKRQDAAEGAAEEEPIGTEQRDISDRSQSRQPASSTAPLDAPKATKNNLTLRQDAYGNLVIDDNELDINRDEEAVAEAANDQPVEDINDFTMQLNRTTWLNDNRREPTDRVPLWKWKSDPWSEEETDRFYEALRMFGTDFFIISKMFHPKTRRMIKTKFNREEKLDPQRINDALNGKSTIKMDLDHYARESSRDVTLFTKYDSIEHAQNVINESMKERQDAMTTAAQEEAQLEAERQEREKEKQKSKEKGRGKGSRKGKKAKSGGTFGGGGGPNEDQ